MRAWEGINLAGFDALQDTVNLVFTKQYGFRFSSITSHNVATGISAAEVDFRTDGPASLPQEQTIRVTAERAMLARLDGSCRTPIAGLAELLPGGKLRLRGQLAVLDGSELFSAEEVGSVDDPAALGLAVGEALIAQAGPDYKV